MPTNRYKNVEVNISNCGCPGLYNSSFKEWEEFFNEVRNKVPSEYHDSLAVEFYDDYGGSRNIRVTYRAPMTEQEILDDEKRIRDRKLRNYEILKKDLGL